MQSRETLLEMLALTSKTLERLLWQSSCKRRMKASTEQLAPSFKNLECRMPRTSLRSVGNSQMLVLKEKDKRISRVNPAPL